MELTTYTKPAPKNPYRKDVQELIKATRADENAAGVITVPAKSGRTERVKFQRAANDSGYTARAVAVETKGDDTKITFVLTSKRDKVATESSEGE